MSKEVDSSRNLLAPIQDTKWSFPSLTEHVQLFLPELGE